MVLVIINWPHAGAGDNTEDSSLWMTQARSFAQINKELLQKPELFYRKPRIHGGNTGDIATRSIEADDEAIRNWGTPSHEQSATNSPYAQRYSIATLRPSTSRLHRALCEIRRRILRVLPVNQDSEIRSPASTAAARDRPQVVRADWRCAGPANGSFA